MSSVSSSAPIQCGLIESNMISLTTCWQSSGNLMRHRVISLNLRKSASCRTFTVTQTPGFSCDMYASHELCLFLMSALNSNIFDYDTGLSAAQCAVGVSAPEPSFLQVRVEHPVYTNFSGFWLMLNVTTRFTNSSRRLLISTHCTVVSVRYRGSQLDTKKRNRLERNGLFLTKFHILERRAFHS